MICYDISHPRRLRKTAKILENYGLRVQKSFFQCEISKEGIQKLQNDVVNVIDTKKDYFYIYPLCEDCAGKTITDGQGEIIKIQNYEIY